MTTILIVEDNELNLKMAKTLLQRAGFQTLEAEDADRGIQLAQTHLPNLILMDMYLPLKDGYQATQELKADPLTSGIPVIAFTALAMGNERQKALDAGCSGFICKPIDVERFAQTIVLYLNNTDKEELTVLKMAHPAQPHQPPEIEAERAIDEFFMIASHDLQAPLRKIDQFTDILKRSTTSKFSAEDAEILERIGRSTQQMHDLLSDILTLSQLARPGEPFSRVDLSTIAQKVIEDNQLTIDQLDAKCEIGDLISLEADPVQMYQLFQILINNGLKFRSEHTPPWVRINSTLRDNICEITIQDNGIGFKQEHCQKIFRPFVRLHGGSIKYQGRGMGLAIAQKIVQRHKGHITATSSLGLGSIFKVVLPV